MSEQCGFILNDLCCCDNMECYGELCCYPDVSECPVHMEPDYMADTERDLEVVSLECAREELRIRYLQIDLYKKEVSKLRGLIELQNKLIAQMEQCLGECDPWLCNALKESLMYNDDN
jgi:hypothetical protein